MDRHLIGYLLLPVACAVIAEFKHGRVPGPVGGGGHVREGMEGGGGLETVFGGETGVGHEEFVFAVGDVIVIMDIWEK